MSAAFDLEDLEGARDELTEAVMALLDVGLIYPSARDELVPAMFKMGSAVSAINRAIEAAGEPAEKRSGNDG